MERTKSKYIQNKSNQSKQNMKLTLTTKMNISQKVDIK